MSTTTKTKAKAVAVPETAITIKTELPEAAEGVETKPYWIGTMPDCPLQNVAAGGVTFPSYTGESIKSSGDLVPERDRSHGIIAYLSDEQLELVKTAVLLRVVRFGSPIVDEFEHADGFPRSKPKRRAHIVMRDSQMNAPGYKYRAENGDVPLARLVYMHRADKLSIMDTKNNWPPHPMERPE